MKKSDAKDPLRIQYQYHCAQLEECQEAPRKKKDAPKTRDKLKMHTFDCHGWMQMTINTDHPTLVALHIKHTLDHVPYWNVHLPPEWYEKITAEATQKNVSQVCASRLDSGAEACNSQRLF